jgi:hypothetical protein
MNASVLDIWLPAGVVQTGFSKCFCWNANDVFFLAIERLELRLDGVFPFSFHNFLDACFAEAVPLSPKPCFTHVLKGFVDKDAAT